MTRIDNEYSTDEIARENSDVLDAVRAMIDSWSPEEALGSALDRNLLLRCLSFRHEFAIAPRLTATARNILANQQTAMSDRQLAEGMRFVAELSRHAQSLSALHWDCDGDTRGFIGGLSEAACERTVSLPFPKQSDRITGVALHVLGRISHEARQHRGIEKYATSKPDQLAALIDESARHRLPGQSEVRRRGHLRRLLKDRGGAADFQRFLEASALSPDRMARMVHTHLTLMDSQGGSCGCYCSQAEVMAWVFLATSQDEWPARTRGTNLDGMLDTATANASPRVDMIRFDDRQIITNFEGATTSFMQAALQSVGSDEASAWHERALAREVRKFDLAERVGTSQAWLADATKQPSSHSGEIDAYAQFGGVLFDLQAKAPNSADYRARNRVLTTEALRQHRDLREAIADKGAHFVSCIRGQWSVSGGRLSADNVDVHVPITVGVEPVTAWSVGMGSELGRVTTSLDHFETVAKWVPPLFRPVYWIDRHLLELRHDVRFIDELDFLGKWLTALKGEPLQYRFFEMGLVMADLRAIEEHLHVENTFAAHLSSKTARGLLQETSAAITRGLPTVDAPRFTGLLTQLAKRSEPEWLPLAMQCFSKNWSEVESRVRAGQHFRFAQDALDWGVWFNTSDGPLRLSGMDCAIIVNPENGEVRAWSREGAIPEFWDRVAAGSVARSFLPDVEAEVVKQTHRQTPETAVER